jgi:hypothetical protein
LRYDITKLICERERIGSDLKSHKTGAKLNPNFDYDSEDYDPGPSRMKKGTRWFGGEYKQLNENLNPLERFLRKSVGRPWNDVNSEIRQRVDSRKAIGFHVLQHVGWWIDKGFPNYFRNYFFIDSNGIFRENVRDRRRTKKVEPKTSIHWYGDTWFKLEVLAAPAKCGCVHFKLPELPPGRWSSYRDRNRPAVCIHGNEAGKRPIWYVIDYAYHSPDEVYEVIHYKHLSELTREKYGLKEPGDRYIRYYRDVPKLLETPFVSRKKVANRKELKLIHKLGGGESRL